MTTSDSDERAGFGRWCRIDFTIRSRAGTAPEAVTTRLGVEPDEVWLKGVPVSWNPRGPRTSGWIVSSGRMGSAAAEDALDSVLNRLSPAKALISQMARESDSELDMFWKVVLGGGGSYASLILAPAKMAAVLEFGVRIEIVVDPPAVPDSAFE